MRKTSARFELYSAGKMRIEDLFVDSQNETGVGIPLNIAADIGDVINGTHKTFRYMLVTGLLAAVTDMRLHPRCLQVTSGVAGAFDARSFCQEVIVPFEKTFLKGRLGGSNEPYANKPARFEMIEKSNKVRKGGDAILLGKLYDVLEYVRQLTMKERETVFKYAMHLVLQRSPNEANVVSLSPIDGNKICASDFFDFFEARTKGESAVASLAAFFRTFYGKDTEVLVHPSTESGASSKEVGDIDLNFTDGRRYAVEVKDKPFTKIDVDHACGKAALAGVRRVIFAVGHAAEQAIVAEGALAEKWAQKGIELSFVKISALLGVGLALSDNTMRSSMAGEILSALVKMNACDDTMNVFRKTFKMELS